MLQFTGNPRRTRRRRRRLPHCHRCRGLSTGIHGDQRRSAHSNWRSGDLDPPLLLPGTHPRADGQSDAREHSGPSRSHHDPADGGPAPHPWDPRRPLPPGGTGEEQGPHHLSPVPASLPEGRAAWSPGGGKSRLRGIWQRHQWFAHGQRPPLQHWKGRLPFSPHQEKALMDLERTNGPLILFPLVPGVRHPHPILINSTMDFNGLTGLRRVPMASGGECDDFCCEIKDSTFVYFNFWPVILCKHNRSLVGFLLFLTAGSSCCLVITMSLFLSLCTPSYFWRDRHNGETCLFICVLLKIWPGYAVCSGMRNSTPDSARDSVSMREGFPHWICL